MLCRQCQDKESNEQRGETETKRLRFRVVLLAKSCNHPTETKGRRFCENCSVERWCCANCGHSLSAADLRPATAVKYA